MKKYVLPVALGLAAGGPYYLLFPDNSLLLLLIVTTLPGLIVSVTSGFGAAQTQTAHRGPIKNLMPAQPSSVFIFNTLHNISALLHTDVEQANRVVELLAELLRIIHEIKHQNTNIFARELKCVDTFLKIEKHRLQGRFDFDLDIDEQCLEIPVPNFLLLPLVEHAIMTGVEKYEPPVSITISAKCRQDELIIEIADLARHLSEEESDFPFQQAFKEKLESYSRKAELVIEALAPSGTRRIVRLPIQRNAVPERSVL